MPQNLALQIWTETICFTGTASSDVAFLPRQHMLAAGQVTCAARDRIQSSPSPSLWLGDLGR